MPEENPNQPAAPRVSVVGQLREFSLSTDWSIFKARLQNYFEANEVKAERKRAILLNTFTEDAYKLIHDLSMPVKPEAKTYEELIAIFDGHFSIQVPIFANRMEFYNARMMEEEAVQEWCARIRGLAVHCDFAATEIDNILRDKFITGFKSGVVQDRLFEEKKDVTLSEAATVASSKMASQSSFRMQVIKSEPIHHLSSSGIRIDQPGNRQHHHEAKSQGRFRQAPQQRATSKVQQRETCKVCGRRNHLSEDCRYKTYTCNICHARDHLAFV